MIHILLTRAISEPTAACTIVPAEVSANRAFNGREPLTLVVGFPDVSANGANLTAYYRGGLFHAGGQYNFYGTSLATPIWASIVTLINEERTNLGKGPIGFINPILYAHPEVFHDITIGTNPGCGTQGFPASPGWDPSTGQYCITSL